MSTQAQIQTDAVNLIVALGGGWTKSKLPNALADAAAPGPPRLGHSERGVSSRNRFRASRIRYWDRAAVGCTCGLDGFCKGLGAVEVAEFSFADAEPIAHCHAHIVVGKGDGLHQGHDGPGRAPAARQPVGVQESLCPPGRMGRQRRERRQECGFRIGQRLDQCGSTRSATKRGGAACPSAAENYRHKTLAIHVNSSGEVDDNLKPLVESAACFARTSERIDKSRRLQGQDAYQARAYDALRRLDPRDRRARGQGVEIIDEENEPVRRAGVLAYADALGERGQERPRRRCGDVPRIEEFRTGRVRRRLSASAAGSGFRTFGGGIRFG